MSSAFSLVPLYCYWNPGVKDHFYTTVCEELRDCCEESDIERKGPKMGYQYEGITCYIYKNDQDGSPLFCYHCEDIGDHYYTTEDEDNITRENETYRKRYLVGYVPCAPNGAPAGYEVVPLYRYWNAESNDHFYTTEYTASPDYQGEACQVLYRQN